ncbi:MAG: peptidase E [Tissierellia bacterium]|nr:peptidase E [Tissierellia bacterium]
MIIAIGGGEVRKNETYAIDKFIVDQAKKARANLLFIPTASKDSRAYVTTIESLYTSLACSVDSLFLCDSDMTEEIAKNKIDHADIIYVGGGDTDFMMKKWREFKVDKFLLEAYKKNKILSGLSAGSICWFAAGFDFEDVGGKVNYSKIDGLGIIPFLNCPHYDQVDSLNFDSFLRGQVESTGKNLDLIAVENQTAIVWEENDLYVIKSNPDKNVYRLKACDNSFKKEIFL